MAMKRLSMLRLRLRPQIQARTLVSKALKEIPEWPVKPPPFPYLTKDYFRFSDYNNTTLRWDENTKLICVEGAHAIGKSEVAKHIAEEFDMLYMPPINMDEVYIGPYDTDFRNWNEHFPDYYKSFDEKDFFKNPKGGPHVGSCDRYMYYQYRLKFQHQLFAIMHILNTGQGVVMEGCANSDHIHFNAAYNQGWVRPEMRTLYNNIRSNSLHELLRPSLILYLDAPAETVQSNIKARGNEWDKDSPVWNNTHYLNSIYNEYRNNWLKDMQQYSRVLVYDWAEGGDLEVIVEDMEKVNMDQIGAYDDQQIDWRFGETEDGPSNVRYLFTNKTQLKNKITTLVVKEMNFCDTLIARTLVYKAMNEVMRWARCDACPPGYSEHYGDKVPFLSKHFGLMDTREQELGFNIYAKGNKRVNMFYQAHNPMSLAEVKTGVGLE